MRVECESRLKKNRPGDGIMVVVAIGINDSRFIDSEPETKIEQFTENIVEIRDVALEYGQKQKLSSSQRILWKLEMLH